MIHGTKVSNEANTAKENASVAQVASEGEYGNGTIRRHAKTLQDHIEAHQYTGFFTIVSWDEIPTLLVENKARGLISPGQWPQMQREFDLHSVDLHSHMNSWCSHRAFLKKGFLFHDTREFSWESQPEVTHTPLSEIPPNQPLMLTRSCTCLTAVRTLRCNLVPVTSQGDALEPRNGIP